MTTSVLQFQVLFKENLFLRFDKIFHQARKISRRVYGQIFKHFTMFRLVATPQTDCQ
jgi:hypothetical protein